MSFNVFLFVSSTEKNHCTGTCYRCPITMNNSTEFTSCSREVSTLFITITSAITFVAFTGNLLVTATFLSTPSLRTSTNLYIVNMAVSDIFGSCFNWLLYAVEGMLTSRTLINGHSAPILCKVGMYSRAVSQLVSVLSLVLIAFDRYIAVVFPLKEISFGMGQERGRITFSLFTWLIALAYGCPYIIYAEVVKVDDQTFCRVVWNSKLVDTIFNGVGFLLFYCIPLMSIAILYFRILKALTERPATQNATRGKIKNHKQNQHKKVTKILISIVVTFFVCWTPLCFYLALKMFRPTLFLKDKCHIIVALFFYIFPTLNTAINPLILFVFSTNFRNALANLITTKDNIICPSLNKRVRPLYINAVQPVKAQLDAKNPYYKHYYETPFDTSSQVPNQIN